MKVDLHMTILGQNVPKRVFDFDFITLGGGEEVVTHGLTNRTLGEDVHVFEAYIRPSLDGEALIFSIMARGDEIRKCSNVERN